MPRIKQQIGEKGQVIIPENIRRFLDVKNGEEIVFEIENNKVVVEKEQDVREFLDEFFTIARTKEKDLTLEDLKKIEDESYDLP